MRERSWGIKRFHLCNAGCIISQRHIIKLFNANHVKSLGDLETGCIVELVADNYTKALHKLHSHRRLHMDLSHHQLREPLADLRKVAGWRSDC